MELRRRDFLKGGIAAGALATLEPKFLRFVGDAAASPGAGAEEAIRSTCSPNCTGACGFMALVSGGRIATLIQSADYPEKEYNPRGCLRGLSMMNLIYGKDRIKYPLIRTGERGDGSSEKRAGTRPWITPPSASRKFRRNTVPKRWP